MRKSNRPIVIDLFAGAGGLSLGFEQAGFDVIGAVEIDPIHALIHEFNFPQSTIIAKSVTDTTGNFIRATCGLSVTEKIDVLIGGAPCQGFSLIGQRALDDPRNALVKEYIRLVGELEPKYFLFENVKGLTIGKHKQFLEEIIAELQSIGYEIKLPWKVLNAKDFHVPQSRERLFLIGAKMGNPLPQYPEINDLIITCKDALHDLPDAEEFPTLLTSDKVKASYIGSPSKYALEMRCERKESWKYGYKRNWNPAFLTSSRRTNHTQISRRRFSNTEQGKVEPISRFFKLAEDGVSNTLRAGTDSSRGAFPSPRPIHYLYPRCVTVREMARLHGFPDWFRFHSTKWHGARQIGNAVPPPLAFSLAKELMKVLDSSPKPPSISMNLGDEQVLYFDMSRASKYFGIKNPIKKRDRKSGAKKRKQEQIESQISIQF